MNEKNVNQTIAALAELNRVEGFSPERYAREISDDGQGKRMYLDVKWRIMWFRLKYPNGKITTNTAKLTDNYAVVESRVYCDKSDPPENYISKGTAQRELDAQNIQFGGRFVEAAETAAIGRALALGGFGLQFCCDIYGGDESDIVDAPIESGFVKSGQSDDTEYNNIVESESSEKSDMSSTEQDLPFETEHEPAVRQSNLSAPAGVLVNTANTNPAAQTAPQNNVKYTKSTPVNEIYRVMTLEEAKNCVVDVGIFQGKTLAQVAQEKPDSIAWYVKSYNGRNNILKAAAAILLEIATNEKMAKAG